MDIFMAYTARRLGDDDVLARVNALLDWRVFAPILKRGLGRSGVGAQGYDTLILFKCLLLGQWHGLSVPKFEQALKVRLDFMLLCGLSSSAPVPDETTHYRFRNALMKGGVYDDLLGEVCLQLEVQNLKMREADAAIIDATLIESAAHPRQYIEPAREREENDEDDPNIVCSADSDSRCVNKGLC